MNTKKTKNKLIIYTDKNCNYCKSLTEELTKEKIEYTEKTIQENNEEWVKVRTLTNMPTTPTVYYNENYLVPGRDFGAPQHLISIVNDMVKVDYSTTEQILERIKTMNYHTAMGFQRIDQLLRQIETKINKDEHKSTN